MTAFYELPIIFETLLPHTGHVRLEASAGTGKTFTLERLLVALIARGEATIDQILAVTFTERAAAELRERMRAMLTALVRLPDGERAPNGAYVAVDERSRARLQRALADFDLAPISTIHGFCNRVLLENAFHRAGPFEVELADGGQLFHRALVTTLRTAIARDEALRPLLAEWLDEDGVADLAGLLVAMHKAAGTKVPEPDPARAEVRLQELRTLMQPLERFGAIVDAILSAGPNDAEAAWDGLAAARACVVASDVFDVDTARVAFRGMVLPDPIAHVRGGTGDLPRITPVKEALASYPGASTVLDVFGAFAKQNGKTGDWGAPGLPLALQSPIADLHARLGPDQDFEDVVRRFETVFEGSSGNPRAALSTARALARTWIEEGSALGFRAFRGWLRNAHALSPIFGGAKVNGLGRQEAHDYRRRGRLVRRALAGAHAHDALRAFDLLAEQQRDGDQLEGRVVHAFLGLIEKTLARQQALTGEYSFRDMLLGVWQALDHPESGPALVDRLRQRYRIALVDEFQDTDDLQWQILERIFVHGIEQRLIVVGDPKQAIYTFRGGDVFTYLEALERLKAAQALPERLTHNFRSTPRLVEVLNAVFDHTAQPAVFTGDLEHPPLQPGRADRRCVDAAGNDLSSLVVFALDASAKLNLPLARRAMARAMARHIAEALGEPTSAPRLLDGGRSAVAHADGRIQASDIFVLTRTHYEARLFGRALRELRVPFAFYRPDGLMQTTEAADVLDVLQAVATPNDRAAVRRAWLTPFFGVALGELYRMGDVPDTHALVRRLRDWADMGRERRYEQLFRSLLERSGLLRREVFAGASERALTNYLHIFELLLDELSATRHALPELLRRLRAMVDGREQPIGIDGNVQRLETERAAVQIMTIHKSKGLQAPLVYLYGGLGNPRESEPYIYHDAANHRLTSSVHPSKLGDSGLSSSERDEEEQRLLYVAMTRAAGQLFVPDIVAICPTAGGLQDHLTWRLAHLRAHTSYVASGHLRYLHVDGDAMLAAEPPPPASGAVDWTPPPRLEAPEPDYKSRRSGLRRVISYTGYARRRPPQPVLEPEPDLAEVDDVVDADAPAVSPLPPGKRTGIALHELLERADRARVVEAPDAVAWLAQDGARDFVERVLTRNRLACTDATVAEAARIVHTALTCDVRLGDVVVPGLARCPRYAPEVQFLYPWPEAQHPPLLPALQPNGEPVPLTIRRGFVTGTIDVLFEHAGRAYFADWKSDLLDSYAPAALRARVDGHYGWQHLFYSLAVAKMLGVRTEADYEARFGGRAYVFLRGLAAHDGPTRGVDFDRPSWDALLAYEDRLRQGSPDGPDDAQIAAPEEAQP